MDVHKDSMAVAYMTQDHSAEVIYFGTIGTPHIDLDKLIRKMQSKAKYLIFVDEASPCGYWLYRYWSRCLLNRQFAASMCDLGPNSMMLIPSTGCKPYRVLEQFCAWCSLMKSMTFVAFPVCRTSLPTRVWLNAVRHPGANTWELQAKNWSCAPQVGLF
jgi:hypothetical protein